jgi:hypothetical protein
VSGSKIKYYLIIKNISRTRNVTVHIRAFFALMLPESEALASASTAFNFSVRNSRSFWTRGWVVHRAVLDSYVDIETNSNALNGTCSAAIKIGTCQRDRHFIALYIGTTLRFLYDMMYLLPAFGLSTDGSSTVHIYTQTIHRMTQNNT